MIGKIKKGNYFYGALKYNIDKIKLEKANRICAVGFEKADPTNREILYEFLRLAKVRPISSPVAHISLNFAIGENLDDETLKKITHEYLTFMGYEKTPYVIFRHNDAAHTHVHIVTANIKIDDNGKYRKVGDSNNFYNNKKVCAMIEKRYGLVVAQGRGKKTREPNPKNPPELHTYGTISSFEQLKEVANYILKNQLFVNKYELNKLLNTYSIAVFESTYHGVRYYKFTFVDKKGKGIGVGGTPKQLRLDLTKQQIDQLFQKNQKELKEYLTKTRSAIKGWLKIYYSISLSDLQQKLSSLGIGFEKSGQCRNLQNNREFTLRQLGIPDGLIKKATIKREYFRAFIRMVTAFRKENNICHETTLLQNDQLLKKLKLFAKTNLSGLSQAQINVLYDGFCEYKLPRITEIKEAESKRDIIWANKLITYVNSLELPYTDRLYLLEGLGLEINGRVTIRNDIDNVVHWVDGRELIPVEGKKEEKSIYSSQIKSLTTYDWIVVKGCVTGQFRYEPHADYNRLLPFIPESYIQQLEHLKNDYTRSTIQQNILATLLPNQYDIKTGKLLHWDTTDKDEEDENERPRRRRKGKRI